MLTSVTLLTCALLLPTATGPAGAAPAPGRTATTTAVTGVGTDDPATTATSVLTITSVSPAVAQPGTPVTITGTVTPRVAALSAPTLRLVRGTDGPGSRLDVRAWAASTTVPAGRKLAEADLPQQVAVGTSVPFTLTVPAGGLGTTPTWGALPLAIVLDDGTTREALHTFVGWQRRKEYQPLSVAVVAPLTLSARPELFSDVTATRLAAWTTEMSPSSRLSRVVRGTDTSPVPVTWALDPAVLGRDGRTPAQVAADPVTAVVAPLLTTLGAAGSRHPIWALPYADADIAATVAANPADPTVTDELARTVADTGSLGPSATVSTGVAWPVDGGLDPNREKGLRTAYGSSLRGALVSGSAVPQTEGLTTTATVRSASGLPLLAWDDTLSDLTLATRTASGSALMTQQFVAETAALLGESPGIDRSLVVAMPRTIDPDPATMGAFLTALSGVPWLSFTTADALLTEASGHDQVTTGAGTWPAASPQVDAAALTRISQLRPTIGRVSAVVPDGADYRLTWNDSLDQLTSSRWRERPGSVATLTAAAEAAGRNATLGIRVSAQTTNFLADEGVLQVTIINDLDVRVQDLRLVLTPGNPRMRVVEQPQPQSIERKSRATVQVRMRAVAAGLVPITATLTTADGTPIGTSADLVVRANPPGRTFYLVLWGAAGLVLVIGLVRTLRSIVRRRRLGPVDPMDPLILSDADDATRSQAAVPGVLAGDHRNAEAQDLEGLSARATEPELPGPVG